MNDINLSHWVIAGVKREYMPRTISQMNLPPTEIVEIICSYFRKDKERVCTAGRKRDIAYVRQMAVYVLCFNTKLTLNEIGNLFGSALTHHTSVRHCREFIKNQLSIKLPKGGKNDTQVDLENIERLIINN